jgi:hypothetical protein
MQYNRLMSETALIDRLKALENRVQNVETQGTGTISFTDEATGVVTIIGELPDGRTGLGEWIGDTEPPAKPSTPIASAYLGVLSAYWDGVGLLGEANPPDYDRTDVQMGTTATGPWFKIGELRGEGSVSVTDQAYGEERWFRFISYDKAGNGSVASDTSSATAIPLVEDVSIATEIQRIDDAAAAANTATGESLSELTNQVNVVLPASIEEAATSLITDSRLPTDGSLTIWPFAEQTIPEGSLQPGAIKGGDLADFSIAVKKFKSDRHYLY